MTTLSLFGPSAGDPYWIVDPAGVWRYLFGWRWDTRRGVALFFLLNPSMGEPGNLDATMKKCVGFARRWHLGGFEIVNPFAFRTRHPDRLRSTPYEMAVGPDNDQHIRAALARRPARVVAGWGAFASVMLERRLSELRPLLEPASVQALRITGDGAPWHPLYVPYSAQLVPFRPATW